MREMVQGSTNAAFRSVSSRTTYKVDSNRRNVGFRVSVIRKSKEQARLSYTGVSNEEELEEIIAVK